MQKKGKETDLGWKIGRRLKLQQSRAPSTGVCLLHCQWGIEEETKEFQIHQFLLQQKQCIISHIDSDSAAWFYALPRLPSYWKVSNNPQTTTTTWEDWHDVVKIAKRIELTIKMGKIEGSTRGFQNCEGSWIRRWLSIEKTQSFCLAITLTAQMSLPRLTSFCHSSLSTNICYAPDLLSWLRQIQCNHCFLRGIIQIRNVSIMVGVLGHSFE